MEKELRQLFDFQKFARNEKLDRLISETEIRASRELSDEDMTLVSAAGLPYTNPTFGHEDR